MQARLPVIWSSIATFSATRIGFAGRKHDAELIHPDALGLHSEVEIEHNWIVGDFETFKVEVILDNNDEIATKIVRHSHLFGDLTQHLLAEVRAEAGESGIDFAAIAKRR